MLVKILQKVLPGVTTEHRFHDTRHWRFDYAWLEQKVALEVEGGVYTNGRHTRGAGFIADMEKYNAATLLGWQVYRCTPQQLLSGNILATLEAAIHGSKKEPQAERQNPRKNQNDAAN